VLGYVAIILKTMKIFKEEICNLSRLPFAIGDNPCYLTALQLLKSNQTLENTVLHDHYKSFNLKTLYDIYNVGENLKRYSYKSIFLPWIHTSPVTEFVDVAFMRRDKKFIDAQIDKMKNLVLSIKEFGYTPDAFLDRKKGHITGYFLENHTGKNFYVVSGNHRVATLSALFPDLPIPVVYEEQKHLKPRDKKNRIEPPRKIYSSKNVDKWPSVTSGFLDEYVAIKIMERYINGIS